MSFDYSLVKKIKPDFEQINKTLASAYKLIKSAKIIQAGNPEGSFTLSYEAMLKITLSLMISNGFRPKIRLGHHKTLTGYAHDMLGDKFKKLAATYEQMRSKSAKWDFFSVGWNDNGQNFSAGFSIFDMTSALANKNKSPIFEDFYYLFR